jgi:dihydroorotase
MANTILIQGGAIVNRGETKYQDILIRDGRIERIDKQINTVAQKYINAEGRHLIPGIIDDQVHFREPGLTHKATIASEARAAVAGGVTSFMEMPNTSPPAVTLEGLEEKYDIAARTALANYSFYLGATNDNVSQLLRSRYDDICGIKVFMGSSTGNMLVDNVEALESIFKEAPTLVATHCEDETMIRDNLTKYKKMYGEHCPPQFHPIIRSREACFKSSSFAVALAKKYNTRLHVLHLTTAEELVLFDNTKALKDKRITAELCVHHLYFNENDYLTLGNQIKCNPAIKSESDQKALLAALLDNRLDVIATDHAPHTWDEKQQTYFNAPSGLPLVQHALPMMLSFYHSGLISFERIVEKMSHAVADCFQIRQRGYLDEGFWADVVVVDLDKPMTVTRENILYQCAWSPLMGQTLRGCAETTIVSGNIIFENGQFVSDIKGKRLLFDR